MKTSILTTAAALTDHDLLARLDVLAANERHATAELVAHLAVLDTRPVLYAAGGYGSLFSYCTQALRLSEDATCNRIEAARACRRFPEILDLLATGALTLTAVRLLGRHLTAENHSGVLARAANRSRREIEALVAELAPRPDAPSLIRRLPAPAAPPACIAPIEPEPPQDMASAPPAPAAAAGPSAAPVPAILTGPNAAPARPQPRPVVQALAPDRYRVQFTIGAETQDKLRRLQALLRREIPDGDPGVIFDRAISLLLEKVERAKLGRVKRPRPLPPIRPGTDSDAPDRSLPPRAPSNAVRRAVWERDGGQCAYVSPGGRRCGERAFLEFHHLQPYALGGEATIENTGLRCFRHNQYEAVVMFGPGGASRVRDRASRVRDLAAPPHVPTSTTTRRTISYRTSSSG